MLKLPCQEEGGGSTTGLPKRLQMIFLWKSCLPCSLRWIRSSPPRPCSSGSNSQKYVQFESELISESELKVYNSGDEGKNWEGIYFNVYNKEFKQNYFRCSKEQHKTKRKHTGLMVKHVAL